MEGAIEKDHHVIHLRLERPHDMFEMPQSDLFSEFRNFLTGVEFCVSELRSHNSRKPVRVEIELPSEMVDDGLDDRMTKTLRRYCDHRIRYNRRERRAVRLDAVTALRIGIPVTAIGLAGTIYATNMETNDLTVKTVIDHVGLVLAWIGLWFPIDTLFFYGHPYTREIGALELLGQAEVVVRASDQPGTLAL